MKIKFFLIHFVAIFFCKLFASSEINHDKCPYNTSYCHYSYINPLKKGHVYVEGEWLYWRTIAQIPYGAVVTINKFTDALGIDREIPDDIQELDNRFKYKSGYTIKLGIDFPCNGWHSYFQYLRIDNQSSDSISTEKEILGTDSFIGAREGTKTILAYWWTAYYTRELLANKVNFATSTQEIKYRLFDWALNKTFCVQQQFALTPFLGVKGGWIRNQEDVTYTGFTDDGPTFRRDNRIQNIVRLINNFYGWGISGGLNSNWILGCGFEIFGKTALSALLGKLYFRHRQNFIMFASGNATMFRGTSTYNDIWKRINSLIELTVGLNWGRSFCRNKFYFGIKGSYVFHYWPSFFKFNRYDASSFINNFADFSEFKVNFFTNALALHGYTLGARFDF